MANGTDIEEVWGLWEQADMKFTKLAISLLTIAAFNSSCSSPPKGNDRQRDFGGGEEVAKFEKYQPFPGATSARLFVQPEPFDDKAIESLSDARGRQLTNEQYKLLETAFSRKTIIRRPAKGYLATSCLFEPRHVFRFYDIHLKPLGDALVCFECGDVKLNPPGALASSPSLETGQTVLSVDYAVLLKLMRIMLVPTYAS